MDSHVAPRERYTWLLLALSILLAAFAGANCSAGGDTGGGTGLGTGAHDGSGVGSPSSTGTTAFTTSSGGGFNPSGAGGSGSGGGGASGPHPTTCDTSCTAAGGTCDMGVCTLTENTGNVDPGTQMQLEAGGTADPSFAFVYPYDATVFPRGLLPPRLQFNGASDAFYVHAVADGLDYKGYFAGSSPASLAFSATTWNAISLTQGNSDVKVEVTKISGGQVAGPISETWSFAPGTLRGTIYYETYNSALAGPIGIMKIQPNAPQPTVVKHGSLLACGCICHTASADGSTLVSAANQTSSSSFDLTNNAATIHHNSGNRFTYGGIYPDGSFVVSATDYRTWIPGQLSHLYDTHTGAQIPTASWDGIVKKSGTTAFSPDGKWIAFNHEDTGGGHTLAIMAYDHATNTFSGMTDIATDPSHTLAWPAFTPDSKWVIYHAGSNAQFETDQGARGDIYAVEVATKTVVRLDALDGYDAAGQTYLPAMDPTLTFAPTVLPEAVGGYYWVVFTSHRSYGNTLPSMQGMDQDGKLWVAAFDIDPAPGKDPSHPAFYLDGQESKSDNLRGFWVLDPCAADGSACESGDQCCGGYCGVDSTGAKVCGSMSTGCSNEFDKCMTSGDCCDVQDSCINGRCGLTSPH